MKTCTRCSELDEFERRIALSALFAPEGVTQGRMELGALRRVHAGYCEADRVNRTDEAIK